MKNIRLLKVIYSVHLNKDADTTGYAESGRNGGNSNKVKLTYSNNPNYDASNARSKSTYGMWGGQKPPRSLKPEREDSTTQVETRVLK